MDDNTKKMIKQRTWLFAALVLLTFFLLFLLVFGCMKRQPKTRPSARFSAAVIVLGSPDVSPAQNSASSEKYDKEYYDLQKKSTADDNQTILSEPIQVRINVPEKTISQPDTTDQSEILKSTEQESEQKQNQSAEVSSDKRFDKTDTAYFKAQEGQESFVAHRPENVMKEEEDPVVMEDDDIPSSETQPDEELQDLQTSAGETNQLKQAKEGEIGFVLQNSEDMTSSQGFSMMMNPEKKALLAVVIDDMGINQRRTSDILSLRAPLTSSFLTYGQNLDSLLQKALEAGHEVMLHAPMEPKVRANLAPDTLKVEMDDKTVENMFSAMLSKFENVKIKGVNNHMGSLFTQDADKIGVIMKILKQKNMFFLDSKTTNESKAYSEARKEDVSYVARDVFLDNENNFEYISAQLKQAEQIALRKGFSIAICHPKSETYKALKYWIEEKQDSRIELVHLSKIVEQIGRQSPNAVD